MKYLDIRKIISTMLIIAIVWLFTTINDLSDEVENIKHNKDMDMIVDQFSECVDRLEWWHIDKGLKKDYLNKEIK